MLTRPVIETTRRVYGAEVAKLIRAELKRHFPATKFSVRTERHGTINVRWTDGPTTQRVEDITSGFEGKGFDGMIDMQYYIDAWVLNGEIIGTCSSGTEGSRGSVPAWGLIAPHDDAERVHFGEYVFVRRSISPELANKCIRLVAEYWGGVSEPLPVAIAGYDGFKFADESMTWKSVRPDLDDRYHSWISQTHACAEDRAKFAREN